MQRKSARTLPLGALGGLIDDGAGGGAASRVGVSRWRRGRSCSSYPCVLYLEMIRTIS